MEFSEIQSVIKKYNRSGLVTEILKALHHIQQTDKRGVPFWCLLTLLKWAHIHTDDRFRKDITPGQLEDLMQLINKFETEYAGLNFKTHKAVSRSFRIIAYQQFEYQENFHNSVLNRQMVLYLDLHSRFDINSEFKNRTGMDILSFFNYSYLTYICINKDTFDDRFQYDGVLGEDYMHLFRMQFSNSELDQYLNLLAIKDPAQFVPLHRLRDERLQLFETNFFITKPFLLFNKNYLLPHRAIFNQTLKHFVYTFMKTAIPDQFSEEFGRRLEKYVELGLKEVNLNYVRENEMKRKYALSKVVDYKIGNNILVECKAIELHPRSGVLREPNMLSSELNSSVIKAYCQLLCTANAIDKKHEWWGIVIIYREMYLGFGQDAWEEFMQEPVEQFARDNSIDISVLPPQNLFFVPLEDWDYMVQAIKDGKGDLESMLKKGKELNLTTDPTEKKFIMEQVLNKHFKIENFNLSYLSKAHERIDILSNTEH